MAKWDEAHEEAYKLVTAAQVLLERAQESLAEVVAREWIDDAFSPAYNEAADLREKLSRPLDQTPHVLDEQLDLDDSWADGVFMSAVG